MWLPKHFTRILKMLVNFMFLLSVSYGCIQCANVQLVNAADPCAGTVLVSLNTGWGTVCDTLWDMTDAAVVCRELNCGIPYSAPGGSAFGVPARLTVYMTEVQCSGQESSLIECPYSRFINDRNCRTYKAAGVHCTGPDIFRLVNGPTPCSGRLEFRKNGAWGTVCDDSWDQNDAAVACRQMGCSTLVEYRYNPSFGESGKFAYIGDLQCKGDETTLLDCPHRGPDINYCPTGRDAGVTCTPFSDKVRLVNSGDACSGRVEVSRNNQWGTVCSSGWDMRDAAVVCRELGCGAALKADVNYSEFGNGVWPVRLSDVQCTGSESSLFECPNAEWGTDYCPRRQDSAVMCTESRPLTPEIYRVSVSADKKTANWRLNISSDGKDIHGSDSREDIPTGPERFAKDECVLGSEGFVSGSRYWEVTMNRTPTGPFSDGPHFLIWTVGVAKSSADRHSLRPEPNDGIWAVRKFSWDPSILTNHELPVQIGSNIDTLGIFLIYEEALILFYDAATKQHLYTFTASFTEEVYPYFCAPNGAHIQIS